ncbi:phenazine biosynthesis protein [Cadophora sp. DSE1049]|nr:phenazine biosynthesis protein [Cadophora sp. DSE1049]
MSSVPFAIVDVFSTTAFKGNPLAVVDNRTTNLSTKQMQLIARQFNLSETTFFSHSSLEKATFKLRSFLPDGREVFGAGHNILGVWWFLAAGGLLDLSNLARKDNKRNTEEFEVWQELGREVLPVKISRRVGSKGEKDEFSISIRQAPPKAGNVHPDPTALAKSIGLDASDIGFPGCPGKGQPQVFSTSTTRHLQVPISSISALNRAVVARDKLLQQLASVDEHAYGLYLFSPEPGVTNSYQARFFSPGMAGEDPATGSAAGPLSAYLHGQGQLELVNGEGSITVRQGFKVGRECLINVTLTQNEQGGDNAFDVDFSGSGVKVASGEILIPEEGLVF